MTPEGCISIIKYFVSPPARSRRKVSMRHSGWEWGVGSGLSDSRMRVVLDSNAGGGSALILMHNIEDLLGARP